VAQPEKLVWHHSSADSDWNIITSPMMPDWPRVRLTQIPLDATEAEIACFTTTMAGMAKGWGSGYEILDGLLVELQA